MNRPGQGQAGTRGAGQGAGSARPGLVPAHPMPLSLAVIQVVLLLGIPLAILVVIKQVLKRYFPELGY